ncbi:MAG: NAD+ synthase, partial [Verrucomicrobia bacterium]|nr:NAD+ synthase [Verrucomicrobiota bacterium]
MKIALAQINTTIGDIQGNKNKIIENYYRGLENNADVVVFPELALTGYPPRDLLLKTGFIEQNLAALNEIAQVTTKCAIIIGFADRSRTRPGRDAANSVALLQNGSIREIRNKSLLPSYDVFDEDRYFEPADQNSPCVLDNETIGLTICEDVWNDEDFWPERRYHFNPVTALSNAGARILFNISASPWHLGKNRVRHSMLSDLAAKTGMPIAYCNLVGGNDELIFDGSSLVLDANGEVIAQAASFEEDFVVVDTATAQPIQKTHSADEEKLYKALTLGTSDYLSKCGFKSALLGLSGGIDSALVATLAVGALGPENVHGVSLPSE